MEVRLSGEQFCKILTQHYKTEVTGFVILDADPSPKGKIIRQAVEEPLDKSRLIVNIKGLRDIYESLKKHITLAEAKWAVENWNTFIDFIDRTNRLPKPGFGSGKNKGILL
jgi:hypothetical protein